MVNNPDAFLAADSSLDLPYENAKFRHDKQTGKFYRRFYGEQEAEIPWSSALLHEALQAGKPITREDYIRDPVA